MGKQHLVAVLMSAATAFVMVYMLQYPRTQLAGVKSAVESGELETRVKQIDVEVSKLKSQIDKILEAGSEKLPTGRLLTSSQLEGQSELVHRLEELERLVENIRVENDPNYRTSRAEVRQQIAESQRPRPIENTAYYENSVASDVFESDSGHLIDENTEETIVDLLHSSNDIDLEQVYCKKTVCKITYSSRNSDRPNMVESGESDFALIDQLSDELGWEDMDVRYARDELGNNVMFIQRN